MIRELMPIDSLKAEDFRDSPARQKLANQNALEFEQIPEPSTWLLLLGGGIICAYALRKRA